MSTYFITTEQAETSEIFECMETIPHNCNCGQSYALKGDYESDGSISHDVFIVCNACCENNPSQVYELSKLEKAFIWFERKGITAIIQDNAWIEIIVNGVQVEISESEIEWRACKYDIENN